MKAGLLDRDEIRLIGRNVVLFLSGGKECERSKIAQRSKIKLLDRVDFHSYNLVRDVIRRIPRVPTTSN